MKNLDVIQKEVERIRSDIKELQKKEEAIMKPVCKVLMTEINRQTSLYTIVTYYGINSEFQVDCYGATTDKFEIYDKIYDIMLKYYLLFGSSCGIHIYSKYETKKYYPEIYEMIKQ